MKQKSLPQPRSLIAACAVAGLFAAGAVQAQGYSGPASAGPGAPPPAHGAGPGGPHGSPAYGYQGPSGQLSTVKQLIDQGWDDQKAVLRGRIVSRDGKKHYTFDDGTAQIRVEIEDKRFPFGQVINDKTEVELFGEFERKGWGRVEFDVDMLRVL